MHDKKKDKKLEHVPSLSELEADVAYFDARLSLLGKPTTYYQKTQEVVYRMLEGMLIQRLIEKRGNELKKTNKKRPDITKKKN
ncbi:hypothetical protein ACFL3U_05875 [Pseudomonadota bacterium]